MFDPGIHEGTELSHAELLSVFQCQQGKGMRCSRATNSLVLVVDHTHKQSTSIYADEWDEAGVLHYRGTGQHGDQSLDYEGNRWLRDAEGSDTGVFLFEKERSGKYLFRGRVVLLDEPYRRREPDADGQMRWVWVFPLGLAAASPESMPTEQPIPLRQAPEEPKLPATIGEAETEVTAEAEETGGITHDQVQWSLLEMGAALGLDVWVATNDRGKRYGEHAFQDAPRLRDSLPQQFDARVMKLIEHIDVLWLRGNRVEAAFEVEHTTSVYSGLLRMSDLVAMSPNLMIRLFIVAPDSRRPRVFRELLRPTFDALDPPLRNICGYISYSRLFKEAEVVERYRDHLKPGFINEIAEFAPALETGYRSA